VPDNNGLELFNTLQNRGVKSRLIHFPDENHWVLKPQNSIFWYGAVHDWLAEFAATGAPEGTGAPRRPSVSSGSSGGSTE
jgi:hypothetical protein